LKEEELRRARFAPDPSSETPAQARAPGPRMAPQTLGHYSPQKAEALLEAFLKNGTWQVPTFPIMVHLGFVTPRTDLWRDRRMQYVPQNVRKIWVQGLHAQLDNYRSRILLCAKKL